MVIEAAIPGTARMLDLGLAPAVVHILKAYNQPLSLEFLELLTDQPVSQIRAALSSLELDGYIELKGTIVRLLPPKR